MMDKEVKILFRFLMNPFLFEFLVLPKQNPGAFQTALRFDLEE